MLCLDGTKVTEQVLISTGWSSLSHRQMHWVSCVLAQPIIRVETGFSIDTDKTVNIEGHFSQEITEDRHINPTVLISLWHNQIAIHDPETEEKLHILTLQSDGQNGLKQIDNYTLTIYKHLVESCVALILE
jgi:hypothetical protein